jgi:hypothetical protein
LRETLFDDEGIFAGDEAFFVSGGQDGELAVDCIQ